MGHTIWRTGLKGLLTAEMSGLRLLVEAPKTEDGSARFRVVLKGDDRLVGSGNRENVRDAMEAAEGVAERTGLIWPAPNAG